MHSADRNYLKEQAEKVYKEMGPYCTEEMYKNAVRYDLDAQNNVPFFKYFQGICVGTFVMDLMWKNAIIEIKAIPRVTRKEYGTGYAHQQASGFYVFILNFSPEGLQV